MVNQYKNYIQTITRSPCVDFNTTNAFMNRIKQNNFSREENPQEHFCSFFVPFDFHQKKVFLGHHIIADDWIPPGGHIEKGEMPIQTVLREFKEELNHTINSSSVSLHNISIIPVRKSTRPCKIHYDFWHIVNISEKQFLFDKKEFYDAGWFSLPSALNIMKREEYKNIVKTIFQVK